MLNFDKLTYAANLASLAPIEASNRYSFQKGDVADAAALSAAFEAFEPEAVLHMAAEAPSFSAAATSPLAAMAEAGDMARGWPSRA